MNQLVKFAGSLLMGVLLSTPLLAKDELAESRILINNVNIFDGSSEKLARSMSVLIEGNKIAQIAASIPASEDMTVIDGGERTLTPGFIDAHVHLMWNSGMGEFLIPHPIILLR